MVGVFQSPRLSGEGLWRNCLRAVPVKAGRSRYLIPALYSRSVLFMASFTVVHPFTVYIRVHVGTCMYWVLNIGFVRHVYSWR